MVYVGQLLQKLYNIHFAVCHLPCNRVIIEQLLDGPLSLRLRWELAMNGPRSAAAAVYQSIIHGDTHELSGENGKISFSYVTYTI